MRINGNNAIRKCTEITDYRRSTEWNCRSAEWLYLPIRTVYALTLLGKILFVLVLPISGSCGSVVIWRDFSISFSNLVLVLGNKTCTRALYKYCCQHTTFISFYISDSQLYHMNVLSVHITISILANRNA